MRHEVVNLSGGWRGTDATVAKMKSMVAKSITDPKVVITAQNLVRHLPERDKAAEIRAVSDFVRGKIRYTNEGVETLKTPRVMLEEIEKYGRAVGDCDDHVILWMSLHQALGNPTRIKVVSQRPSGVASHIYGEVQNRKTGKWIPDDTIVKNKPIGWSAPAKRLTKTKDYAGLGGLGDMELTDTVHDELQMGRYPGRRGRYGGAPQFRVGHTMWIPSKRHMGVAQRTLPSHIFTRGRRGMAVSVSEHDAANLGFISGDLLSSISKSVSALAPAAMDVYTKYRERKKKKKRPLPAITAATTPTEPTAVGAKTTPPAPTPPKEGLPGWVLPVGIGVAVLGAVLYFK